MNELDQAFIAGYACLSARAELLDRINVFPVADGDTGVNLRISLAPLLALAEHQDGVAARLVQTATGNSGNIAVTFLCELLLAEDCHELPKRAVSGCTKARQAVADPKDGTMLNVFDALAGLLARTPLSASSCPGILAALQEEVLASASTLPELRTAGVVDAGALGMFVFFDGFLRAVTGVEDNARPLSELFPERLAVAADFHPQQTAAHCVDALILPTDGSDFKPETAGALGNSVVVVPDREKLKIHIHTDDPEHLRTEMARWGEIVSWSAEAMAKESRPVVQTRQRRGCLHLMTDAAGSLSKEMAKSYDITLLDSYIVSGDLVRPESLCDPETVYTRMRSGGKVTTAQASLFERHQYYQGVVEQHGRTLYLCVGSAFTGNHAAALTWKERYDPEGRLHVVDSGAASGRLGVMALLAARYARNMEDAGQVLTHARYLGDNCREYVFIDALRYLVAGGRLSRTSGFFGDLLHMKPVISPMPEGVRKVGVVRNQGAQIAFAEERLREDAADWGKMLVLLQYTDNRDWVCREVQPRITACLPQAEVVVAPLSLTSGVHMGPGTWSVAVGPEV